MGANPIEEITHRTGDWALRLLLVTLAVTPIRRLAGWQPVIRFRRMLGLFAFFYATLHFSTYLVFDHFFDLLLILEDVAERRYVTAGFFGFVLMIPLAVTSTQGWIRRLGRRWTSLHRLVYLSAAAGVRALPLARQNRYRGAARLCGDPDRPPRRAAGVPPRLERGARSCDRAPRCGSLDSGRPA